MNNIILGSIILLLVLSLIYSQREKLTSDTSNWRFSSTPWIDCSTYPDWCVNELTRLPGGSIESRMYPRCGNFCESSEDCPKACKNCIHNTCS